MIVRLIVFFQPTFRIPHSPVAAYWSLHLTHRSPIIPAPRVAEVRTHKGRGRMSGSVTSFRKWNRARITNWRHTEMFSIRTHTHTHMSVSDDHTTAVCATRLTHVHLPPQWSSQPYTLYPDIPPLDIPPLRTDISPAYEYLFVKQLAHDINLESGL